MADDWDFETARAALREQVARRSAASRIPPTPTGAVPLRHRVATTAALATVASAVVVGSWWAAAGGSTQSTAITSDARPVRGAAAPVTGSLPSLATVGGVQVVSVPAPGGGWVQVIVGPVAATPVGSTTAVDAPLPGNATRTGRTDTPVGVVAAPPAIAAPAPVRSAGGAAVTPPPPRTSTPAPTQAPTSVPVPTTDPPVSSPVPTPPSTVTPPNTPAADDQTGSGAAQSGETGGSGTP